MLTPEQMREDVAVLRGVFEESHVGLYWFVTEPDLDRRFEAVSAALDRPMTARAFHRLLLPVVAAVRHGHTTLTLPTESVGHRWRLLDRGRRYLPLGVRVLDGRLYVAVDLTEEGTVEPGTEVVAVDGRPVAALLDTMRAYLSADGANDTFKNHQLGNNAAFAHLLDLLFGPAEAYVLDVVPLGGGAVERRTVAALPPARMAALYRERTGRDVDAYPPALAFEMLGDRAALLTVSSFYEGLIPPGEPGFEAFFAGVFRRVREAGVEDLVVDVRGNEGGNGDYPPLLYSYLADRPFRLAAPTTLASLSMSYVDYADGLSDDVRAFLASPLDFVRRAPDSTWVLNEAVDEARYRDFAPQPDAFTGRLYVLTDGGSFSATNEFVDLVYRYHRRERRPVRFVGEPNGGDTAYGRVSGGQQVGFVLPHSRQRLTVPLLGSAQHFGAYPGEAHIPDALVTPSSRDIGAGVDRVLEFVRNSVER